MNIELLFEVGDRVDILRTMDDSERFYSGVVVAVDDSDDGLPYQVEIDQTGHKHWFKEDEIGLQPTPEQLSKFRQLVDRVLAKMTPRPEPTYVPGVDGQYHIGDGNGGTLCKERMALNATIMQTCDKCEKIQEG